MTDTAYKFSFIKNHPLVEINKNTYIIDTGSPVSFSIDGHPGKLTVNSSEFLMPDNPMEIDEKSISRFIGEKINGFIGMDILTSLDSLYMNKSGNYAVFGKQDCGLANCMYFKKRSAMRLPFLETLVMVNGREAKAIIDSGACISYISEDLTEGCSPAETLHDYAPAYGGEISADGYNVTFSAGSSEINTVMAKMTEPMAVSLGILGCKAVTGFGELPWNELLLDIGSGCISYE